MMDGGITSQMAIVDHQTILIVNKTTTDGVIISIIMAKKTKTKIMGGDQAGDYLYLILFIIFKVIN
mgnify:CR=1 FL=1|jgi:hypothetical protein